MKPPSAREIAGLLNALLADAFALYLKTKNFHWHMSGPHSREYHQLLDEQADQIFAITDPMAERVRELGERTLRSVGQIARLQLVLDNDSEYVDPLEMLAELRSDNQRLAARLRKARAMCEERDDVVTASLLETWLDEAERRTWFLFEASGQRGRHVRARDVNAPASISGETREARTEGVPTRRGIPMNLRRVDAQPIRRTS
jgi:starvation-inducible DNA-binding protein